MAIALKAKAKTVVFDEIIAAGDETEKTTDKYNHRRDLTVCEPVGNDHVDEQGQAKEKQAEGEDRLGLMRFETGNRDWFEPQR